EIFGNRHHIVREEPRVKDLFVLLTNWWPFAFFSLFSFKTKRRVAIATLWFNQDLPLSNE
ncbi:hypothetical protein Leryth_024294, partial [Lithospermum erythrorhizon]